MDISSSSLPWYTLNGAVVVSVPGGGSCCFGFLTVGVVGGGFFIGLGDLDYLNHPLPHDIRAHN